MGNAPLNEVNSYDLRVAKNGGAKPVTGRILASAI